MLRYMGVNLNLRYWKVSICKSYNEANNKLLKLDDPSKPSTDIMCLGANNLCGHSMMQLLLIEILDWANPEKLKLDNYCDDGPIGCFLIILTNCMICTMIIL